MGLTLEPPVLPERPANFYANLTDEELADRLRVVRFVNGLEYTQVHADVAGVRLARQKNAAKKRLFVDSKDPTKTYDPDENVAPVSLNLSPLGTPPSSRGDNTRWHEQSWWLSGSQSRPQPDISRNIIGSGDERIWVDSIGQTFARPTIKFVAVGNDWWADYSSSQSGCSGTMIGNDTAMTAAHCLYNILLNVYTYPLKWGVDTIKWRSWGSGGPWTIQTYYPLSSYGFGCFDMSIPGGWTNGPHTREDDFAVIEFTCGYHPGATTGYVPVGVGDQTQIDTSSGYLFAHDFVAPLPVSPQAGWEYARGSMIRREGMVFVKPDNALMLQTYMDTMGGSSGGGYLKNLFWMSHGNPNYYWSGVNTYQDAGLPNSGRRSDWLVWGFIKNGTYEW